MECTMPDEQTGNRPVHGIPPAATALLSTEAVLLVDGADAHEYLHGQFSSGIADLAANRSVLTSYSDPRGRLLAVLRVVPRGPESLALVMDAGVVDTVADQLRKYALRARVTLTQPGDDWQVLGLQGSQMQAIAERHLGALPRAGDEHALAPAGISSVRLPGAAARWMLLGPRAAMPELPPGGQAASAAWHRQEIEAGVPRITAATRGEFVAQMINLDRLEAIDFRKGCYPGQEVIARTHYLGRIKRRMFILDIAGDTPEPGTPVHAPGQDAAVGTIVDAQATDTGSVALAVLRLAAAQDGLHVGAPEGAPAVARVPPYGLEEAG